MSTSDFDEGLRQRQQQQLSSSSRMFYHPCPRTTTGPDVTLATNAVSVMSLQYPVVSTSEAESPDLVVAASSSSSPGDHVIEGATTALHESLVWKIPPPPPTQQRMSHSYCTGPSHMYL